MKRRFNFFHRGLITNLNQDVSAIETTEGGMSISSAFLPLLKDISYYPVDKLKRFLRFFKKEQSSGIETNKINVSHFLKEHYQLLAETGILKRRFRSITYPTYTKAV